MAQRFDLRTCSKSDQKPLGLNSLIIQVESFLIFNILETSDENLQDWLSSPLVDWDDKMAFKELREFATKTQYTNDGAER